MKLPTNRDKSSSMYDILKNKKYKNYTQAEHILDIGWIINSIFSIKSVIYNIKTHNCMYKIIVIDIEFGNHILEFRSCH